MNAFECKGKFIKDGYIDIPLEIKKNLKKNQDVRLIILTEEDYDENNKKINALKSLNGLLSEISDEDEKKFDELLNNRVSFHREGFKL